MARLWLSCLGPFQVTLDGRAVTGFKSNKVRALLAYLAVEADRPHRREVLAGLLWPDWPDREALSNLRYALSNLRRVIDDGTAEPPYLLITRDSLQFNAASDSLLDVAAFTDLIEPAPSITGGGRASLARGLEDLSSLEKAVSLYRGSFLEGFSIGDSPAFEEWALFSRERLTRQMSSALHHLAAAYEQHGKYEQAHSYARRQVELEPWDEVAHQQLMRALALDGQRGAALAQYKSCRQLLAEELGVEPGAETTRLYEQIRDGELKAPVPASASPPDLSTRAPRFLEEEPTQIELPVFVARDRELGRLDVHLDLALAGQGRVVFLTGEVGTGKTALAQAFTRRAQDAHSEILAAGGNCNAYTGIGDPYLPFREILELLTGDVEARWAAGAISREHARRLWNAIPVAAQTLTEVGPDLIDTFVPRAALLERAGAFAPQRADWLTGLAERIEKKPAASPDAPGPQQIDLFEQYTRVLQAMAQHVPVLLVLDDLQWADPGSISLLFHLGRRLAGSRILVVAAFRSEEVAIGRDGQRHPLDTVVHELQREHGDIILDVGRAESQDFLEAVLDSEPNRLGIAFREMFYRQTRGHPLFTIELLRGLQERGDIVQDSEGSWVEGPNLNWETLPARVEAAIAERINRLSQPLRSVLRVACVEGEDFTAEVIARVLETSERVVVERLSSELDRRHRLVRAQVIERLGSRRVSRYRFRHNVFQRYLYEDLDEVERAYLHEDVGNVLEELYQHQASEATSVAPQLARHFREAKITHKAIHYLHQAGENAVRLSAYQEGIAHLTSGLNLLMTLPDSDERSQQEFALQTSLTRARIGDIPGPGWESAITRARELCQQMGKTTQLSRILGEHAIHHYVRAEYLPARELAEEALSLAEQARDPLLVVLSHWQLGFILCGLGEFTNARAHLEQMISFYKPQEHHHTFVLLRGSDPGLSALAYDAVCLWCLGYPEQALQRSQESLSLARELDHAFSLADVLCFGGCLFHKLRQDVHAFKAHAEELVGISKKKGFSSFWGTGVCHWGDALTRLGEVQEGIVQMREGLAARQAIGAKCFLTGILGALAEAQGKDGRLDEGLATLAEALALVEEMNERYCEAELHRLKGELLLAQGQEARAEASYQQAIDVARRLEARSWELRAAVSLSRLWQQTGKAETAQQMLQEILGWFTEGFDMPEQKDARALLEELS